MKIVDMKVISYSLFGYNKERQENCFDFNSYLRGLMINIRLKRLLFREWTIYLHTDRSTYEGFQSLFDNTGIEVIICNDAPLAKAMLWRMKPAFDERVELFICRDIEAPLMYKDAQAVTQWVYSTKAAHAITASESHTIPMMGGMIGFKRNSFKDRTGFADWDSMVNTMGGYERKGADQDFLNYIIYPKYANGGDSSIMQHYFKGMPNTFLDGYLTCQCPQAGSHKHGCHLDISLGATDEHREVDQTCGHIGAAGWYEPVISKLLMKYKQRFTDLINAEDHHREIFNWKI
mgnify:CR=1 FL=1